MNQSNGQHNAILNSAGKENAILLARQEIAEDIAETTELDTIGDRLKGNARPINLAHVEALYESIDVFGLLEPIVVDREIILLAGGHRREALRLLRERSEERFYALFPQGHVPITQKPFSSRECPELALEIEIAENDHRLNYSKAEILNLARKLLTLGYTNSPGRPKEGEKRLKPALSTIFGKSFRTVERYLAELNRENDSAANEAPPLEGSLKDRVHQSYKKVRTKNVWRQIEETPKLRAKYEQVAKLLEELLEEV